MEFVSVMMFANQESTCTAIGGAGNPFTVAVSCDQLLAKFRDKILSLAIFGFRTKQAHVQMVGENFFPH